MAKPVTVFVCTNCDSQFPKWTGRCSECGQWGTLVEQVQDARKTAAATGKAKGKPTVALHEVQARPHRRLQTGIGELDRVLGGGLVPGSLVLLGGDPGIGKSTLVLQLAQRLSSNKEKVLYISGEESADQIALRLRRLEARKTDIAFLSETQLETILSTINDERPSVAVLDSIQTLYSADVPSEAGSIQQVRAVTVKLMQAAKAGSTAFVLIGHVTKEGAMAGPKALEHLVDVVMYLEGEDISSYRILRTAKNRFGSTNEVGVFDMGDRGLAEVLNPSAAFLAERQQAPGAAVTAVLEGTRPFAVEIQALASPTVFGMPRRTTSGVDLNRLHVLAAVLTRRGGLQLGSQDIFVNVVGGLKIQERAIDVAVCLAIASSLRDVALPNDVAAIGEVGLGGELRNVPHLERRLQELKGIGIRRVIVPASAKMRPPTGLTLLPAATLRDALAVLGRQAESAATPGAGRRATSR